MKLFFPYDTEKPSTVIGEEHTVVGGKIRLLHIPLKDSLVINGFAQASNRAVNIGEFYCNFRPDSAYREADRVVYFHPNHNFQTVTVSYKAVGSPVTAEDMNEIRDFMIQTQNELARLRNLIGGD